MHLHAYVSRAHTKFLSQFITSHLPFLVIVLCNYLTWNLNLKSLSLEPSLDVPQDEDDNHSDGDFDNESVSSDGDGEFYTNGRNTIFRLKFRKH